MNTQSKLILKIAIFLFFFFPKFIFTSDYAIKLEKINDGVWVFIPSDKQKTNKQIISNIGIIEGDMYSLVIDTGNSKSFSNKLLKEYQKLSNKPVKYLIITHRHFDHSFGIESFISDEIDIYMDANEFSLLKSEGPLIEKMIEGSSDEFESDIDFSKIINLKVNHIESDIILDLGNRRILVKNVGRAHSQGDLIVYDYESKIYFAGDLVFVGRAAAFSDANVRVWLKKIEKVFNLPWVKMLPGHGRIIYKKEKVEDTKSWLEFIDNSIKRAIVEGDMISEILDYTFPETIKRLQLKNITLRRGLKKQLKLYKEKNYIE